MHIKVFLLAISGLFIIHRLLGQNEGFVLDRLTNPAEVFAEFDARVSKVKGTHYLDDHWNIGIIRLKNNKIIKNYPLKYDIENQWMEVKFDHDIKLLDLRWIRSFEWVNGASNRLRFVNSNQYTFEDGVQRLGVFEILSEGELSLLTKTDTEVREANYVPALDMGDMDKKIYKVEKLYVVSDNTVKPFPKKKSEFFSLFGDNAAEIDDYAKVNKLKYRNKRDARQIFHYYNSLN